MNFLLHNHSCIQVAVVADIEIDVEIHPHSWLMLCHKHSQHFVIQEIAAAYLLKELPLESALLLQDSHLHPLPNLLLLHCSRLLRQFLTQKCCLDPHLPKLVFQTLLFLVESK